MPRLFRSHAETEDPTEIPQGQRPHGFKSVARGGQNAWQWLIGYNDNEANRIGVPTVSTKDWANQYLSNPGSSFFGYLDSLFPFTKWIGSYNTQWLLGDVIAGVTVALVLVPQSMSYAVLANLKPEFGLYSSFVGVMIYALFATSKDVTIGPVAVMSLQTANVINQVMSKTQEWSNEVIASALAFICGVICLGIGLLRLGWIVEFIPTPAVSGFMTGSAITIAIGQVPKLMGISGINTNGHPSYRIAIDTLKGLGRTKIDAAFGLVALFFLYAIRSACVHLPRRYPKLARACFFASVFRSAFVIIVLTIASRVWVGTYNHQEKKYPISILKTVPRGFQHMGTPTLSTQLWADMAGSLPVSVIVLLLEHIAIAKSFGRINNYKINPNQELIAIGVTNLVGPCFGAYAATGSFSRSAIKAKSGVRTPIAGWITGLLVLIAIYALTGTFYWIPNAALSAVIIHAVGDLIASPRALYKFWLVSPLELIIWLAAVMVTVFTSVENGVYTSVAASIALLLIRIAHPRGRWLGVVKVHHGDSPTQTMNGNETREVFVPLDDKDGLRDPSIRVEAPPPGVFIYRFEEAFTYPNASHLADLIMDHVKLTCRPGRPTNYLKLGDRPWNNPGPVNPALAKAARFFAFGKTKESLSQKISEAVSEQVDDNRPTVKAIVFDFSGVSNVDTTSIQTLVDVRSTLERYADGPVEFHFANILSPWIRRALLAGDFGTGSSTGRIVEVAPVVSTGPVSSAREAAALRDIEAHAANARRRNSSSNDGDSDQKHASDAGNIVDNVGVLDTRLPRNQGTESPSSSSLSDNKGRIAEEGGFTHNNASQDSVPILWGQDLTPFFHLDLSGAYAAAAATAHQKQP